MPTDADRKLAARLLCVGFAGTVVDDSLREMLRAGVSGVILFARNATTHAGAGELVRAIKCESAALGNPKIFASIDHEGGRVVRLVEGMTIFPPMREVGALGVGSSAEAARIGKIFARELRAANFDVDFAPVVDVDSNAANPVIGARSFSSDSKVVSQCATAFIEAMQAGGVAACAKHFPGHGDTDLDSHLDLPLLPHAIDRLLATEIPPFIAAARAGVASIMTAHVVFEAVDPGIPATMSRKVIEGVLRSEIGFDGVVFSDDLEMGAIVNRMGIGEAAIRAIDAGVDCLLVCHRIDCESGNRRVWLCLFCLRRLRNFHRLSNFRRLSNFQRLRGLCSWSERFTRHIDRSKRNQLRNFCSKARIYFFDLIADLVIVLVIFNGK